MAVYPVAAGTADLSGTYIPTLYASKMLVALYATLTVAAITNTDYEALVKQEGGDKVIVRLLPDIVIRNYVKGQGLTYESPAPSTVEFLLDKGKYWAVRVNLVDVKQSDIDYVSKWSVHAGKQMAQAIDIDVLSGIYGSVHANNKGLTAGLKSAGYNLGVAGTPLAVTKVNILDTLVDCGSVLDEQNVAQDDRFIVLPSWMCGLIKKSDLKDASLTGDSTSVMRNGRLGMIDRFEVFNSNNLTTTSSGGHTATECIFGTKMATTFATQVDEKEIFKDPNDFGDKLRALQVYGYKVVKSAALGHLHCYSG